MLIIVWKKAADLFAAFLLITIIKFINPTYSPKNMLLLALLGHHQKLRMTFVTYAKVDLRSGWANSLGISVK